MFLQIQVHLVVGSENLVLGVQVVVVGQVVQVVMPMLEWVLPVVKGCMAEQVDDLQVRGMLAEMVG